MSRRAVAIAAAGALIAAVAGAVVWFEWVRGDRSGPVRLLGDDPRILVYTSSEEAPSGLGVGLPLTYDPDTHCLYVVDRQGESSLVIWPRRSEPVVRDGRRGAKVPGVGIIVEGDTITEASILFGAIHDDFGGVGAAVVELGECIPSSGSAFLFYRIQEVRPGEG